VLTRHQMGSMVVHIHNNRTAATDVLWALQVVLGLALPRHSPPSQGEADLFLGSLGVNSRSTFYVQPVGWNSHAVSHCNTQTDVLIFRDTISQQWLRSAVSGTQVWLASPRSHAAH
jgi:hypothetical protein